MPKMQTNTFHEELLLAVKELCGFSEVDRTKVKCPLIVKSLRSPNAACFPIFVGFFFHFFVPEQL